MTEPISSPSCSARITASGSRPSKAVTASRVSGGRVAFSAASCHIFRMPSMSVAVAERNVNDIGPSCQVPAAHGIGHPCLRHRALAAGGGLPGAISVCGMLTGAGLLRLWPHDRAHYFFSRTRWNPDDLGIAAARLVVSLLVPDGEPVEVLTGDTLFRRRGKKVAIRLAWEDAEDLAA
jgi:hypothetical protein